jgi:hypothetical protein
MTGYYLISKKLRNLSPYATESLFVAFDADLPCKGDFWWKLKGGDLKLVIILFTMFHWACIRCSIFPMNLTPNTSLLFYVYL